MSTLPRNTSLTVLPKLLLYVLVNQLKSWSLLIFHYTVIFMVVMPRNLTQDDSISKHWILIFQGGNPCKNPPSVTFCAHSLLYVFF